MIGLRAATEADKLHLAKCFSLDEWHRREHIENWMATDITTFFDEQGALLHMAFNQEGLALRMHAQFDPMAKTRTAKAIPKVLAVIAELAITQGIDRLVFYSESPRLISYMQRLGFRGESNGLAGDYSLALFDSPNGSFWENMAHHCRFGLELNPEDAAPYQKGNFGKN